MRSTQPIVRAFEPFPLLQLPVQSLLNELFKRSPVVVDDDRFYATNQCRKTNVAELTSDSGGICRLSSIMILKDIVRGFNGCRLTENQLYPWQVFDMIGLTSISGLSLFSLEPVFETLP